MSFHQKAKANEKARAQNLLSVSDHATPDEIKRAYKAAALAHHPDKGGSAQQFQEIKDAYDVLANPEQKTQPMPYAGQHFDPFEDILNQFRQHMFTSAKARQPLETPIQAVLHITLVEAYHGIMKKDMVIIYTRPCDKCKSVCTDCKGVGSVTQRIQTPMMTIDNTSTCGRCGGSGCIRGGKSLPVCECKGVGTVDVETSFSISLPMGIRSGMAIHIPQACHGRNLHIKIAVDTGEFEIVNHALRKRLHMTLIESIVGKDVEIAHPSGETIRINTRKEFKEIIKAKKPYVIPSRGMPIWDSTMETITAFGDMILIFEIPAHVNQERYREDVTEKEIEALEAAFRKVFV
jgi:molecular chaperone DnaJ